MTRLQTILISILIAFAFGGLSLLVTAEPRVVVQTPTNNEVILHCKDAQSLTYNYEVNGTEIIDLDTGGVYNYWYCIPINAKKEAWDGRTQHQTTEN